MRPDGATDVFKPGSSFQDAVDIAAEGRGHADRAADVRSSALGALSRPCSTMPMMPRRPSTARSRINAKDQRASGKMSMRSN